VAHKLTDSDLACKVGTLLSEEKVIGWFNGRMEFGPRALGLAASSATPAAGACSRVMNLKIKFRESFRRSLLACFTTTSMSYFNLSCESPYMMLVAEVAEDKRLPLPPEAQSLWGIDKLNVPRSSIPAVTHVDLLRSYPNCRSRAARSVLPDDEKLFRVNGCPVIVNTSFNVRGEPIVCTPEDAYRCFMYTHMDALVLGNHLLLKEEQPPMPGAKEYLAQFALD